MINKNKDRGITLVALVITIIILLILAGITISSLTNTGLFGRSKEAKEKTQAAEENQAKILNEYEDELNKYVSGTVKEQFKGKTVDDAIEYADALNKNDNTELQDAYGNKIVVPAGFKITNDATTVDKGIVIEDATSGATAGSQFVWVPVGKIYTDEAKTDANAKTITLGRYDFDTTTGVESTYSGKYIEEDKEDTTTTLKNWGNTIAKNITNFKTSVATNGGYYIGRYEARKNSNGTITEVKTDTIWNKITQSDSATKAQKMYNNDKFISDLTNSYAWDTAITFIQKCTDQTNYANKTSFNNSLSLTGTTNDKQCNIFDMASNAKEWTTETSLSSDLPCVGRGGNCGNTEYYTSIRFFCATSDSYDGIGFRPILYMNV